MKRSNSERDFIFSRNVHRSAINKFVSELIYHVDIIKSMLSSFYSSRSQYYDGGGEGNSQKIQVWEYGRFPKTLTLLKRKKYVIFLT